MEPNLKMLSSPAVDVKARPVREVSTIPVNDDLGVLIHQFLDPLVTASEKLSEELCKEKHAEFMVLVTAVGDLAGRLEVRLIALKREVQGQEVKYPGALLKIAAVFSPSRRTQVRAMQTQRVGRDLTIAAINEYRVMAKEIRQRPVDVYQKAVEHVQQLLLLEDVRYLELLNKIDRVVQDLDNAERKNWSRISEFKDKLQMLKELLPRMELSALARALQKVQESQCGSCHK